ncbi:hypothetical protein GN956_G13845 [Arapaima gigas]
MPPLQDQAQASARRERETCSVHPDPLTRRHQRRQADLAALLDPSGKCSAEYEVNLPHATCHMWTPTEGSDTELASKSHSNTEPPPLCKDTLIILGPFSKDSLCSVCILKCALYP